MKRNTKILEYKRLRSIEKNNENKATILILLVVAVLLGLYIAFILMGA